MIQDQVRLPLRVAVGVVMQGIRIRFGRSLVTVMGVVLGIAFLMASLTGQLIKKAVYDEDQQRAEVRRMASFLSAEMGPPLDRTIGVVQVGPLGAVEIRLLKHLIDGGLGELRWCQSSSAWDLPDVPMVARSLVTLDAVGQGADSVVVVGAGPVPDELRAPAGVKRLLEEARGKIIAHTRSDLDIATASDASIVKLAPELRPDEIARAAEDARKARFRTIWVVTISLLVTVVGITNAMLMSVTERFQEIGTMKCLGALSSFIRRVFLVESSLMGAVGGVAGACAGAVFSVVAYGLSYGLGTVLTSFDLAGLALYFAMSVVAAVVLSVGAAIYPASVASSMVPANALRTNI